jgi:hypothetical protein
MIDYIELYGAPTRVNVFHFEKEIGKLRVFSSTNDTVFILDPDSEEIIKYKTNGKGKIDKKTAYKFSLSVGRSLKEWSCGHPLNPNLNCYHFNSEVKNKEQNSEEKLSYYIEYSPEEKIAFVKSIFQNLKQPCFVLTTIIRFLRDGVKKYDEERIKNNIYKYVLLPNKTHGNLKINDESERNYIKKIELKNTIIYEDHTKYNIPKEYYLDAKKRFEQNIDCHNVCCDMPFYEEYLKEKKKQSEELTFKEFLLKNQNKKLYYNKYFSDEDSFRTFNEEYEQRKQTMFKHICSTKEEYVEYLENKHRPYKTYDELKKWIAETKEKEPRGYGLTIGTHVEPMFKRYFSINARGYYFLKDITIMFSVDGYGKDFIYEFKTCIARRVEHNLNFAKEQANLYAYITNKKRIIIEVFSYEEDKIYHYEYPVDTEKAKEQLERFYKGYKLYFKSIE